MSLLDFFIFFVKRLMEGITKKQYVKYDENLMCIGMKIEYVCKVEAKI